MLTDRSAKSRSPAFPRRSSPPPALKMRSDVKPRVSLSPNRNTPAKTERKSPPKLQTMFKQVCCPNCRYLFKVIKDDVMLMQTRQPQLSAGIKNMETQTMEIVKRDIAIVTKEIEAILLPTSFDNVELPRFDQQSRITRKTVSSQVSGHATMEKFYKRLLPTSSEGMTLPRNLKELYLRLHESEQLVKEIVEWLRKEPPGSVSQIPSYIKTLVEV